MHQFWIDEEAQDLIEYTLLLAFVTLRISQVDDQGR